MWTLSYRGERFLLCLLGNQGHLTSITTSGVDTWPALTIELSVIYATEIAGVASNFFCGKNST